MEMVCPLFVTTFRKIGVCFRVDEQWGISVQIFCGLYFTISSKFIFEAIYRPWKDCSCLHVFKSVSQQFL